MQVDQGIIIERNRFRVQINKLEIFQEDKSKTKANGTIMVVGDEKISFRENERNLEND